MYMARGRARERHRTCVIVDRSGNSGIDIDQQRLNRSESRGVCDLGDVRERAPIG